MKLKHGKKYETADGVVYLVRKHPYLGNIWDVSDDTDIYWDCMGVGFCSYPDLIHRHYKKPQPAHKLDLKQGDVVELVTWEDGHKAGIGEKMTCIYGGRVGHLKWELNVWSKGHRPLFRVVSRA